MANTMVHDMDHENHIVPLFPYTGTTVLSDTVIGTDQQTGVQLQCAEDTPLADCSMDQIQSCFGLSVTCRGVHSNIYKPSSQYPA
jgi:hypothetical protein